MYSRHVSETFLRRFHANVRSFVLKDGSSVNSAQYIRPHGTFIRRGRTIRLWFREQSVQVFHTCRKQVEFIAAQRVRRTIQIFHLYTRIWDEMALRGFIRSWRRSASKNIRQLVFGSVGITVYNWDQNRIPDKELVRYVNEIDEIHKLQQMTVMCSKCNHRLIIGSCQPDIIYCECNGKSSVQNQNSDGWQPFIERKDMLIWKREEPKSGGLFSYKVYGSFPEITAADFLKVQIDTEYRREWDDTIKELKVIDTDPNSTETPNSCSNIIYWEMIWPSFFANRDYVYQRKWLSDKETGVVVIMSKGTEHPTAPCKKDCHRVNTYWSYMVIKPYKDFNEPGIEFGLTYFDDPGVNIPNKVTSWVAMTGLPNYLERMRNATKNYQEYKAVREIKDIPLIITKSDDEAESNDESIYNDSDQADENVEEDDEKQFDVKEDLDQKEPSISTDEACVSEESKNDINDSVQEETQGDL